MSGEELRPEQRRYAVLAVTRGGCRLGRRLAAELGGTFHSARGRLREIFEQAWPEHDGLICVMATGIVVRMIAPLLVDKQRDPAVVVCDELGRFAISLVSGHIGGANALAERVAGITGGLAVVTTSSDLLNKTALDLWCRDLGLIPASSRVLTRQMGRLVDGCRLRVHSDYPLAALPPDLQFTAVREEADLLITAGTVGPAAAALLHPRALVVGIGCRRGTAAAAIDQAVAETCARYNLALAAVAGLASIDLKRDEAGLLDYARQGGLPLSFYPAEQLNQVTGIAFSETVLRVTGAKGVAEPAALLAAGEGSRLLVGKIKWGGVTTAVAEMANPFPRQHHEGKE